MDCSYGFWEKRSAHDALRALELSIIRKGVNYLLDVDIKGYFDNIDHQRLMDRIKERIVDRTLLRLIGKWLKVGVLEEGKRKIQILEKIWGYGFRGITFKERLAYLYLA